MTNAEKYKTHKERAIAHQQWCKEHAVQGWWCTLECDRCFLGWLKLESYEEEKNEND